MSDVSPVVRQGLLGGAEEAYNLLRGKTLAEMQAMNMLGAVAGIQATNIAPEKQTGTGRIADRAGSVAQNALQISVLVEKVIAEAVGACPTPSTKDDMQASAIGGDLGRIENSLIGIESNLIAITRAIGRL